MSKPGPKARPVTDRLWEKVDARGPDDCWLWKASRNADGYGHFWDGRKCWQSHRFVWTLTRGEIPEGMDVLHKCDNPPCCNPAHLFVGTHLENMQDKAIKGRGATREQNGENNASSKLTEARVRWIFDRYALGDTTHADLASTLCVTRGLVGMVLSKSVWGHVKGTGVAQKGIRSRKGEDNKNSRLTEADVENIRQLYQTGNYTLRKLAGIYGTTHGAISGIVSGRTWKHVHA